MTSYVGDGTFDDRDRAKTAQHLAETPTFHAVQNETSVRDITLID